MYSSCKLKFIQAQSKSQEIVVCANFDWLSTMSTLIWTQVLALLPTLQDYRTGLTNLTQLPTLQELRLIASNVGISVGVNDAIVTIINLKAIKPPLQSQSVESALVQERVAMVDG